MNDITRLYAGPLCRGITEYAGDQIQPVFLTLELYADAHEVAVDGLRELQDLFTGHISGMRVFFVGCHTDQRLIGQPPVKIVDPLCEIPVFLQNRPYICDLVLGTLLCHIRDPVTNAVGKRCRYKRTETPADQQCGNDCHNDPAGGSSALFPEFLILFHKLIFILKTLYRYLIRYLKTVLFLFRFVCCHSTPPILADNNEKHCFCAWIKYIAFPCCGSMNL